VTIISPKSQVITLPLLKPNGTDDTDGSSTDEATLCIVGNTLQGYISVVASTDLLIGNVEAESTPTNGIDVTVSVINLEVSRSDAIDLIPDQDNRHDNVASTDLLIPIVKLSPLHYLR